MLGIGLVVNVRSKDSKSKGRVGTPAQKKVLGNLEVSIRLCPYIHLVSCWLRFIGVAVITFR